MTVFNNWQTESLNIEQLALVSRCKLISAHHRLGAFWALTVYRSKVRRS